MEKEVSEGMRTKHSDARVTVEDGIGERGVVENQRDGSFLRFAGPKALIEDGVFGRGQGREGEAEDREPDPGRSRGSPRRNAVMDSRAPLPRIASWGRKRR